MPVVVGGYISGQGRLAVGHLPGSPQVKPMWHPSGPIPMGHHSDMSPEHMGSWTKGHPFQEVVLGGHISILAAHVIGMGHPWLS